jgi:rubredoxin
MNYPAGNMFKLHDCAVCQLEMKPGEGVSVHGNMPKHSRVDPWGGPFLCSSCQAKKVAMEGKLHSTSMDVFNHELKILLHDDNRG